MRNEGQEMILFTDTAELAKKYATQRDKVVSLLANFMNDNDDLGVRCHLLDVAPLSMEFSRQEHWSRWPFPTPGDLSNPWT